MKRSLLLLAVLFLASKATLAQVPSYVPSNGLVGWWPFNGNANDESGNGLNGTVHNAILNTDRMGNSNNSFSFNGGSDRIVVPNNSLLALNDLTISFWMKTTYNGAHEVGLVSKNISSGYPAYWIYLNHSGPGQVDLYVTQIGGAQAMTNSNVIVNDGNWHLIAATRTSVSGLQKIFIDGSLSNTSNGPVGILSVSDDLLFGETFNGDNQSNYVGQLDDIGIWNRALDSCEIKDLYFASLGNCCSAAFNTQPQSVNTTTGSNASFVAQSTSLNAIYQWQTNVGLGWQNLSNAGQYSGITNDTLIVSNLTSINNQQLFRCVLTNGNCSDTSSQALLNVCDGFATQPSSLNAVVAQNASFTISSLANNPIYQWQSDLGLGWQNLSNAGQYSGVNNDTLVVTNLSAANNNQLFRCILTSGTCSDTSAAATLSVSQTNGLNTLQNEIISIYPNPATNQITILSNAARYPLSYKVYNELGQALLIGDLMASTTSIDISRLAPGNYMLVVGTKHLSFVKGK